MKRKKEMNDAQMTLQDQIAATEFKIRKLKMTLELVHDHIQKLRAPPASSKPSTPRLSPDCSPV